MLIYPGQDKLPGLGYNVKWTPKFYNMATQTTSSGAAIDLAFSDIPTHDFELTYEFLHDGISPSEMKILMGFFLAMRGNWGRFLFENPDDNSVTGEIIGTTDSRKTLFGPIQRTYGWGEYAATEPVGQINTSVPAVVYLDSVLQDPSTYSWVTASPCRQYLQFNVAPAAGHIIVGDFSYYYYCKFSADSYTFEKFMDRLWTLGSIVIHSCRAGA